MAKRAIEEEFDRLYSKLIEHPDALPRLRKRARIKGDVIHPEIRCKLPSATVGCGATGQPEDVIVSDVSHPVTQKSSLVSPCVEQAGQDIHCSKSSIDHTSSLFTSPSSSIKFPSCYEISGEIKRTWTQRTADIPTARYHQGSWDESHTADDVFLFYKPKVKRMPYLPRCLNLDVLWAKHAKTWLLPKHLRESQKQLLVFLKRNLRQGKVYFRRYLNQRKTTGVTGGQRESHSPNRHSGNDLNKRDDVAHEKEAQISKDKPKLKDAKNNMTQKRKEHKPRRNATKVTKANNNLDEESSHVKTKKTTEPSKVKTVVSETRKPNMKDSRGKRASVSIPSKKVWSNTVERQVAICRPTTTGRSVSLTSMKCPGHVDDPKWQSTCVQSTGICKKTPRETKDTMAICKTKEPPVFAASKPLLANRHCGGVWKSIVDEC